MLLDDFLRNQKDVSYRTMQPCPYGQAFVRFNYIHERDLLIQQSPHQFGNGTVSFIAHDRAWNHRMAAMTHEVWCMMLGLDLDLWTRPLVEKVVSSFGQLLIWEEDHYFMSRAIVKVRVSSLEEIPWFFVFTEGVNLESDSWSVQCEVLQATILGNGAQDEDFPPDDVDFDPNDFHYHGFGQPSNGPPPPPPVQLAAPNVEHLQATGWSPRPQQGAQALDVAPDLVPLQPDVVETQEPVPVEELVQVGPIVVEEPAQAQLKDVLAMYDNTDALEDEAIPPQPVNVPVEVVHFPNLQNI